MIQSPDLWVTVVDDCSVDATPDILKWITNKRVISIRYGKRERRAYYRVPKLINAAYDASYKADYYMISGDDTVYSPRYVDDLIARMERDGVDIASGQINNEISPNGSGRLISERVMRHLMPFPLSIGWETGMLYKAMSLGFKIRAYPIKLRHLHRYSVRSTWTFGHSAYVNGIPLFFTLFRCFKTFLSGSMRRINTLSILLGHIEYWLKREPKLETADYVSRITKRRIIKRAEELTVIAGSILATVGFILIILWIDSNGF